MCCVFDVASAACCGVWHGSVGVGTVALRVVVLWKHCHSLDFLCRFGLRNLLFSDIDLQPYPKEGARMINKGTKTKGYAKEED